MEVHAGWMPPSEEPPAGVQAFQELQVKFIQLTSQQKHVAGQLQQVIKTGRIAALTLEQLKEMQDAPRTFVATGKAYFVTPREEVLQHLTDTDAEAKKQSSVLLQKREVLEKQIKAAEGELRELLQHSPALARALATHDSS